MFVMSRRAYQVKQAAELAGVSVRTLHHYDAIGLLVPSGRTEAGYRLYDDDDLLRLQQIQIGRELGLPLEEIRRSLDDPSFDRRQAAGRPEGAAPKANPANGGNDPRHRCRARRPRSP
jgi:DNA-binding transcriptional MerR regulator